MSYSKLIKGVKNPQQANLYMRSKIKGYFYKWKYGMRNDRFECGPNLRVLDRFEISGPGRVILGDDVLIEGGPYKINTLYTHSKEAVIQIGSHCYLNGLRVGCHKEVIIGNWCIFADVRLMDNDAHSYRPARWNAVVSPESRSVVIDDNVWVCMSTIILKGVKIGRNSVIGAGSVVSNDIPENCIAAGNPASVVREFSKEEIEESERFFDSVISRYGYKDIE